MIRSFPIDRFLAESRRPRATEPRHILSLSRTNKGSKVLSLTLSNFFFFFFPGERDWENLRMDFKKRPGSVNSSWEPNFSCGIFSDLGFAKNYGIILFGGLSPCGLDPVTQDVGLFYFFKIKSFSFFDLLHVNFPT